MRAGDPIREVKALPQADTQGGLAAFLVRTAAFEAKPDSMVQSAMDAALDPFAELNRDA